MKIPAQTKRYQFYFLYRDEQPFNSLASKSAFLLIQFGHIFAVQLLSWRDFPGQIDEKMSWPAHIYWSIQQQINDYSRHKLTVDLIISKRSWFREQRKSDHLLNHEEQGHYLIGTICVLQFLRRVDYKKKNSSEKFEDLVFLTFERTIREFLDMERRYDNETEHHLNYKMQQKCDNYIFEKLEFYQQIFDSKKNKFDKLSESPSRDK